jgi:hypothetical protein
VGWADHPHQPDRFRIGRRGGGSQPAGDRQPPLPQLPRTTATGDPRPRRSARRWSRRRRCRPRSRSARASTSRANHWGTAFTRVCRACDCHRDAVALPHAQELKPASCNSSCHSKPVSDFTQGAHAAAQARNDPRAPNCTTCHGSHEILKAHDRNSKTHPLNVVKVCGECHQKFQATPNGHDGKVDGGELYRPSARPRRAEQGLARGRRHLSTTATCRTKSSSAKDVQFRRSTAPTLPGTVRQLPHRPGEVLRDQHPRRRRWPKGNTKAPGLLRLSHRPLDHAHRQPASSSSTS